MTTPTPTLPVTPYERRRVDPLSPVAPGTAVNRVAAPSAPAPLTPITPRTAPPGDHLTVRDTRTVMVNGEPTTYLRCELTKAGEAELRTVRHTALFFNTSTIRTLTLHQLCYRYSSPVNTWVV